MLSRRKTTPLPPKAPSLVTLWWRIADAQGLTRFVFGGSVLAGPVAADLPSLGTASVMAGSLRASHQYKHTPRIQSSFAGYIVVAHRRCAIF